MASDTSSPVSAAILSPPSPSSRATSTVRLAAALGFATPMLVTTRVPTGKVSGRIARIRRSSNGL